MQDPLSFRIARVSAFLALVPAVAPAQNSDPSNQWRLPASQLECIKKNIDRYYELEDDPLVIFPSRCPDIGGLENSGGLFGFSEEDSSEPVLILTNRELSCLMDLKAKPGHEYVELPMYGLC